MAQSALIDQGQQTESVQISCNEYEVLANDRVIAYISYDEENSITQPWMVKVNGEEIFCHQSMAWCERYIEWHYKNGSLPAHDEWLTATEELNTYIEEQAEEIAPEPVKLPTTEVKAARELKAGNKIVLDKKIWKLDRINIQAFQYQLWQSDAHGVKVYLTLLPEDYKYRPYQGNPTDWNASEQHKFAEADRFVKTAKYLEPFGEEEFDVVMKAVLPMPDTADLIGYDFCLANNIQFKQRTGQSGTIYWYGSAPHYYNQPGREYRTIGFPELKKTVKAAVEYLAKCNARGAADMKQQLNEEVEALDLTTLEEQSFAKSEMLEYVEEKSNEISSECSRIATTAKQLVPVAFALVLAVGMMSQAIAAKKKPIQPPRNPDGIKEQLLF